MHTQSSQILRLRLNCSHMMSVLRMSTGRSFQIVGPETRKLRQPKWDSTRGTMEWVSEWASQSVNQSMNIVEWMICNVFRSQRTHRHVLSHDAILQLRHTTHVRPWPVNLLSVWLQTTSRQSLLMSVEETASRDYRCQRRRTVGY